MNFVVLMTIKMSYLFESHLILKAHCFKFQFLFVKKMNLIGAISRESSNLPSIDARTFWM